MKEHRELPSTEPDSLLDMASLPEPYQSNILSGIEAADWQKQPTSVRWNHMNAIVGNTALFPIQFPGVPGTAWAKAELQNGMSGSHYDRLWPLVQEQLKAGVLRPGDTVYEASSGNLGDFISVALRDNGLKVRLHVPLLDNERTMIARAAGAEIVTPTNSTDEYIPEVSSYMYNDISRMMRELDNNGHRVWTRDSSWFKSYGINIFINNFTGERRTYWNHSANPKVPVAMGSIALEMVEQLGSTRLDCMVLAIGNFASIAKTVPILRAANKDTKFFGFEDEANASCRDEFYDMDRDVRDYSRPELIGTSAHGTPVTFKDLSMLYGIKAMTNRTWKPVLEWFNTTHPEQAAGRTSGAALALARIILKNRDDPKTNVGLILYESARKHKHL